MLENWKLLKVKTIFKSLPFNLLKKRYLNPTTKKKFAAYVLDAPDWANIVAINDKNEILLVRQFRFGTDKIEMEIPGGCLDKGEDPKKGAQRELREETGFHVELDNLTQIGVVDANPAIQNNRCYTFLAEKISSLGEQNLDPDEIIEFEFASQEKVRSYIRNGQITNTYIIAAFHWLALQKELS